MGKTESIKDFASALGEAVGKLVENGIKNTIKVIVEEHQMKIGSNKLVDKVGIDFEIDLPILKKEDPIALVDIKYLRYKKHARDKGSWVVVAHNRLKATFLTIKRSLVILLGTGWTDRTKKLISTSCIDVESINPALLDDIMLRHGVKFIWDEKDEIIPKLSWKRLKELPNEEMEEIEREIVEVSGIKQTIENWLKQYILEEDPEEKLKLDYMCK